MEEKISNPRRNFELKNDSLCEEQEIPIEPGRGLNQNNPLVINE